MVAFCASRGVVCVQNVSGWAGRAPSFCKQGFFSSQTRLLLPVNNACLHHKQGFFAIQPISLPFSALAPSMFRGQIIVVQGI